MESGDGQEMARERYPEVQIKIEQSQVSDQTVLQCCMKVKIVPEICGVLRV